MRPPVLALLSLLVPIVSFAASDLPDVYVFAAVDSHLDRGAHFPVTISVGNAGRAAATGVMVTIDPGEGVGIADVPAGCDVAGRRITCGVGTIEPRGVPEIPENLRLVIQLIAPDVNEAMVAVTADVRENETDSDLTSNHTTVRATTFRAFLVTTDADRGDGSLRAAIEQANANPCSAEEPCKIAFRIPPAGAAWRTIRPRSPLPALTADGVTIDGTTQTRFFGDTNPRGPEIEINGAEVGDSGSGLDLAVACTTSVLGLTVNGFPDAGLLLHGPSCEGFSSYRIAGGNYVGCDPTGTIAEPNGRGIVVDTQLRWPFWVVDNVVSGNRRSGIYVANGGTMIVRNTIGLGTDHRPLGNGASGVYVGAGGHGTDILDNQIGFNHDSGVSIDRDAYHVSAAPNSFHGNWQLAIDFGLDGVSTSMPFRAEGPAGTLHVPEITAARYDPVANETVIEGLAQVEQTAATLFGGYQIHLYANDAPDASGHGEGQYTLGVTQTGRDGRFHFTYPGHLPGPWVAATVTNYSTWGFATTSPRTNAGGGGYSTTTSEFGRAVQVSD